MVSFLALENITYVSLIRSGWRRVWYVRIELHVAIPTDREFTSPSRYAISMVARASISLAVTCLGDPLVKLDYPISLSNTILRFNV